MPRTAARPDGFTKQALCKVAFAGYGRTAVGAPPVAGTRPTRRRLHALVVCLHRGISQALRASFWSVACGQSCCVCPRPPVGLAAARHWPRTELPVRPPSGLPQPARKPRGRAALTRRHSIRAVVYGVAPPHSGVWATRRHLFSRIKVQRFDPSASPVLAQKKSATV